MDLTDPRSFEGWLPVLADGGPPATIEWCMPDGRLDGPFFQDDVERWLSHPFNQALRRRTDLRTVVEVAATRPDVVVRGIILHQSRCGSTLLGSLLAASGARVISEASVVDSLARADVADGDLRSAGLASVVRCLGALDDRPTDVVLKLDSWATRSLDVYRAAFPDVPMVFCYRDPAQVIVSHVRRRGGHTVPHALPAELFGATLEETWGDGPEQGIARVIAAITQPVVDADGAIDVVRYDDLPGAVHRVAERFGLSLAGADEQLDLVSSVHAKQPQVLFVPDSAAKDTEVTPAVTAAVDRWLTPLHGGLDAIRADQLEGGGL